MARKPDLILDTNVLRAIYSPRDLSREAEQGAETPAMQHRIDRARDALLVACLCHEEGLATGSLQNEAIRQLMAGSPPGDDGLETIYTTVFIYFVKDHILDGWFSGYINQIDDAELTGTACDNALLRAALDDGLPLVTDEGNTPTGIFESKRGGGRNLRGKAREAGVDVYTPGELWRASRLDPIAAQKGFFERFGSAS